VGENYYHHLLEIIIGGIADFMSSSSANEEIYLKGIRSSSMMYISESISLKLIK